MSGTHTKQDITPRRRWRFEGISILKMSGSSLLYDMATSFLWLFNYLSVISVSAVVIVIIMSYQLLVSFFRPSSTMYVSLPHPFIYRQT